MLLQSMNIYQVHKSEEMAELYNYLGLTVGLNLNSKSTEEKRESLRTRYHL